MSPGVALFVVLVGVWAAATIALRRRGKSEMASFVGGSVAAFAAFAVMSVAFVVMASAGIIEPPERSLADERRVEVAEEAAEEEPPAEPVEDSEEEQRARLEVEVRFTGAQFVINNGDDFDWTDCELAINAGFFDSGYTLSSDRLEAGETYTVGALQFANSDGERFNPVTHKATGFQIACDTPQGRGFYAGERD